VKVITKEGTKDIWALWYEAGIVKFIDQRVLPEKLEFFNAKDYRDVAFAIKDMIVRGAPAIGAAGALGMAQAYEQRRDMKEVAQVLRATRPTAHDLFFGISLVENAIKTGEDPVKAAKGFVEDLVDRCRRIGENGAKLIKDGTRILTHCNAGALATVDYGTALAPMRVAHRAGKEIFVFVDETRPRLQGAKLTAWELKQEGIPHALIADNAAGHFLSTGEVDMVITGADRITASGDFANKIGTFEKAVVAKACGVPFYVAAPISTFDPNTKDGKGIPIEERGQDEVLFVGGKAIAPEGTKARNPAFDVTPHSYVKAFITEAGIFKPSQLGKLDWMHKKHRKTGGRGRGR
jgi:translation initiation factor eIF-2B subunit alpha/methylthioribose-1-phosphate isomerase